MFEEKLVACSNFGMADADCGNVEETSPKTALSTSFTISFEDENQSSLKQKKVTKTTNMFVRRHVRTLSLPIENACALKVKDTKNQPDTKEAKLNLNGKTDGGKGDHNDIKRDKKTANGSNQNRKWENEPVSDTESEGGTYTLDKGNKEVLAARKSIDQVFGISTSPVTSDSTIPKTVDDGKKRSSRMVDDWMERNASSMKPIRDSLSVMSLKAKMCHENKATTVSKIPSPVFGRREFNVKGRENNCNSHDFAMRTFTSRGNGRIDDREIEALEQPVNSPTNGDIDTVSYLKETETIVAALHNRLQSDLKQCDEPEKEKSHDKYSNTRFNRAFSLRRDRLKKPAGAGSSSATIPTRTTIPVRKTLVGNSAPTNSRLHNLNGYNSPSADKKTRAVRLDKPSSAPVCRSREQFKSNDFKNKLSQRSKGNGGIRSNSSLSAQEIEFQNWKRRKSYDPLKAAAEDKKKKSTVQSSLGGSVSVSFAALEKKQKPVNLNKNDEISDKGITRSASFHGLRNKNGSERCSISGVNAISRSVSSRFVVNEDSTSSEAFSNVDDDEWMIPKPPSTSLQNTPPESVSSRLSLLSHAMSSSSVLLSSSSNTKVNFMTLLNVTELTREIRSIVSSVANSLNADNSDERPTSQKQNGYSLESKTDCSDELDIEENTFLPDNDSDLDEDCAPDTGDDDSKSNDLSGDYQLNIALNNLKQIQDAVQKLQLFCANK